MKNTSDKVTQSISPGTNILNSGSAPFTAQTMPSNDAWLSAAGPVPIRMTNDYLFRALLQRSNPTLKGLICSLLHLHDEEVISVDILNPIELGTPVDAKTFFLDVKVSLNNQSIIHLEMQVSNQYNWPERSLSYLCRNFDSLKASDIYQNVKPVIQIGLLDYTLFPEYPEFYATYKFRNVKNHHLYSDKLRLCVLDLSRIDLATTEDKSYQIDHWAFLFKSTTWEEIRMLAKDNIYIAEAASTVYQLSQEEMIRLQCEAREDYYRTQLGLKYEMEKRDAEIESLSEENQVLSSKNKKLLAWALEHGYQLE